MADRMHPDGGERKRNARDVTGLSPRIVQQK
jgi:hypothetical protein